MKSLIISLFLLLGLFSTTAFSESMPAQCYAGQSCSAFFSWDGLKRSYTYHLPTDYSDKKKFPLIFALHGAGGTGGSFEDKLLKGEFDNIADRDGFIIVYPDAVKKVWNHGANDSLYSTADDAGFLRNLMDYFIKNYPVDKDRVYFTGISSGGLMTYRMACENSGKIAAIATVIASMPQPLDSDCSLVHPVSVLMINGTHDHIIAWNTHEIRGIFGKPLGARLSVPETLQKWVALNNIAAKPTNRELPTPIDDGIKLLKTTYQGENGAEVILIAEVGAGHTWPGGYQYLPVGVIGKTSENYDGSEEIWQFFKRHSL